MALPQLQSRLTNWSKTAYSPCFVSKVANLAEIANALSMARTQRLTVIPHGAGHSYTDAALNTCGLVIDITPMRRILSWDPAKGIMRVEPGAALQDILPLAWKNGWWPFVTPSTPEVTIGGCTAMNVNGRNAWKCGSFGAHILSLQVMLPSGEICTLDPDRDPQLFYAFVGSMGLLGVITSITLQLQRIASGFVSIRKRSAASFDDIFSLFAEEEEKSDFMEAWLDGFARGPQLGRGILTCASLDNTATLARSPSPTQDPLSWIEIPAIHLAASLAQPVLLPAAQMLNQARYWWDRRRQNAPGRHRALVPYTFWPAAAFAGYPALFPEGVETFQAFVPRQNARDVFERVMRYSQEHHYLPVWCTLKQHRRDPFLLSYQVDGFSLELNYQRTSRTVPELKQVLEHMIAMVIEAGGRFYLAKDHFLTQAQYRRSVGDESVDAFLDLKQRYDPEMLFQSDLFRRIFQSERGSRKDQ